MIININDNWRLRPEARQVVMEYRATLEEGKTRKGDGWQAVLFPGDLAQAFEILYDRQIWALEVELPPEALDALTKELQGFKQEIREALKYTNTELIRAAAKILEEGKT